MRHIIAHEGTDIQPGVFVTIGSIQWNEDKPIPIMNHSNDKVIGKATNLRREEDGSITADLEFDPELKNIYHPPFDYRFGIFQPVWHWFKRTKFVTSGLLADIGLVPQPGFPKNKE